MRTSLPAEGNEHHLGTAHVNVEAIIGRLILLRIIDPEQEDVQTGDIIREKIQDWHTDTAIGLIRPSR